MVGKEVIVKSKAYDIEAKGTVVETGCFLEHYVVDMGKIYFDACGSLDNKLLCHKNELTIISKK